jgi:UDP-N-acetylmuramate--L-alanine ligase/UDP-N-acetylenolpyruvoylglucosamine reductase
MGICGVGAAAIAWMLHLQGWKVSGCDSHLTPTLQKFFGKHQIEVLLNHSPEHLATCDAIVYSAAIHEDNPELMAARASGKIVMSRGECLAGWVSEHRTVAVCGTHGKTTTSCFVTRLLQSIGQEPLWCLGGYTTKLVTNAGPRHKLNTPLPPSQRLAVAEADESDGTLAYERPAITVITNIELDHVDHFKDDEALERCFAHVVQNTREGVAVCADMPKALRIVAQFNQNNSITYGFSTNAKLRATNLRREASQTTFSLFLGDCAIGEVTLPVPGDHNVLNALAAMSAGLLLGFDATLLAQHLPIACAELPRRRFQWLTPQEAPVRIVSDYAHHPAEIQALLSIVRLQNPKRLRVVFQPHRYSRTKQFLNAFVEAFHGLQEVILLPVYAASEAPIAGGSSHDLYAAMRKHDPIRTIMLAKDSNEVTHYLRHSARAGDLILIVGAGDVESIARNLTKKDLVLPIRHEPNEIHKLLKDFLGDTLTIREDEPLSKHSFYRLGGVAETFVIPKDVPALATLKFLCAERAIPFSVIGCGANSWFSDLGLAGVLCSLQGPAFEGFSFDEEKNTITVGAGLLGIPLLKKLTSLGLSGLEFMYGIPGTVGGWVAMNAGAHGHAIWETIVGLRGATDDGLIRHYTPSSFTPTYRHVKGLTNITILEVTFQLKRDTPEAIEQRLKEFYAKRLDIAGLRSCGSLFKNPTEGPAAGALLDQLGAKSLTIGGANVAPQHANILVAGPEATSSDLLALRLKLAETVLLAHGLTLQPEVKNI